MSTPATGNDVSTAYTNATLVDRWLPDGYLYSGGGATPKGQVTSADITDLITRHSRVIDAKLWTFGLQTPFPATGAANPALPKDVEEIATFRVAADIAALVLLGNRSEPRVEYLEKKAEEIEARLKANPETLGRVQVTTPEDFTKQAGSGSGASFTEAGVMLGPYYRLKNRNIRRDSIRFVKAAGKEAFNSSGFPFRAGVDYTVISAAEGTLAIVNSEILALPAAGGGVTYEWGWVRLDRHQLRGASLTGVGR